MNGKIMRQKIHADLLHRFDEDIQIPPIDRGIQTLVTMAARGTARSFTSQSVSSELLRFLAAIALSSPTKSDLQQRDIIIVEDKKLREHLHSIIRHRWLDTTPALLIFLGQNRRQRQLHKWHRKDFANDHLDAFFNASIDAAIALSACITAAEAIGLGACPISQIRNDCPRVRELLGLPDHVFPVSALALGWPDEAPIITPRLSTSLTVHTDRYDDRDAREQIEAYDLYRDQIMPYGRQRDENTHGHAEFYSWSEEKARHYSKPERDDFGSFIRDQGFNLD